MFCIKQQQQQLSSLSPCLLPNYIWFLASGRRLLEVNWFLWHHPSFWAAQEKWSVRAEAVLRGPLGSLQSHQTSKSFKTQTSKYLDGIQSFPLPCDLFPEKNQIVGKRGNHLNWTTNSQNCYWSLLQKGAPWKLVCSNIFLKVGELVGSAKTRQSILEARGSLSSRFPLTLPGFAFQMVNNSSHLLGLIMCLACVQKDSHDYIIEFS